MNTVLLDERPVGFPQRITGLEYNNISCAYMDWQSHARTPLDPSLKPGCWRDFSCEATERCRTTNSTGIQGYPAGASLPYEEYAKKPKVMRTTGTLKDLQFIGLQEVSHD